MPVADHATGRGQAVGRARPVELIPRYTGRCPSGTGGGVHLNPFHQSKIDHQAALGDGPARQVVAASSDRDLKP
jgi:hypothetical protein